MNAEESALDLKKYTDLASLQQESEQDPGHPMGEGVRWGEKRKRGVE